LSLKLTLLVTNIKTMTPHTSTLKSPIRAIAIAVAAATLAVIGATQGLAAEQVPPTVQAGPPGCC
jgi:hypothetical protein